MERKNRTITLMNIYLDIDGVILDKDLKPVKHLKEFLEHITNNHEVYWLTTHCKGDSSVTLAYLSRFLDKDIIGLLKKVKPTSWNTLKTEAVDFTKDFVWLDDYIFPNEKQALERKDKLDRWLEVDLKDNKDGLLQVLKGL